VSSFWLTNTIEKKKNIMDIREQKIKNINIEKYWDKYKFIRLLEY
jgi:hypothetical protein